MEKNDLAGYLEYFCHLVNYDLNASLQQLALAADESQVHTFGWPIGIVLHTDDFKPKPISQEKIQVVIDRQESFDYWTLDKNGNYYILKSLFEDRRAEGKIFFDTRTVRTTELLLRTANLYLALGIPGNEEINLKIEYGGLLDRILVAANPARTFSFDRKCSVNEISTTFQEPIENLTNEIRLKEMVYETILAITEVCEMFVPSKSELIDPIVENFLNGRII